MNNLTSIRYFYDKIKSSNFVLIINLILFGLFAILSFWLLKIESRPNSNIVFNHLDQKYIKNLNLDPDSLYHRLVASKNSKFYYYSTCPKAQKIKKTNQIWFNSIQEAKGAHYLPSQGCSGLK